MCQLVQTWSTILERHLSRSPVCTKVGTCSLQVEEGSSLSISSCWRLFGLDKPLSAGITSLAQAMRLPRGQPHKPSLPFSSKSPRAAAVPTYSRALSKAVHVAPLVVSLRRRKFGILNSRFCFCPHSIHKS